MHIKQRSTVQFSALTHISRGMFDITPFLLSFSSLMSLAFLLYTGSFIISHNQKSGGVIGPYFFTTPTVTANTYLQMLQEFVIDKIPLQIRREGYFQQDGAPSHFARNVRACLDQKFSQIG